MRNKIFLSCVIAILFSSCSAGLEMPSGEGSIVPVPGEETNSLHVGSSVQFESKSENYKAELFFPVTASFKNLGSQNYSVEVENE